MLSSRIYRTAGLQRIKKSEEKSNDVSEREREIATLLAQGSTNRHVSEGTVKNYVSSIYDKTGIHDRVKLVVALSGNI